MELGTEPRASRELGKGSAPELHPARALTPRAAQASACPLHPSGDDWDTPGTTGAQQATHPGSRVFPRVGLAGALTCPSLQGKLSKP